MDIRKGDKVLVISGDDRGSQGEVHSVIRARWGKGRKAGERKVEGDRVLVAGVNLMKKHQRRTGNVNTQFGIIERCWSVRSAANPRAWGTPCMSMAAGRAPANSVVRKSTRRSCW
jgi:ribosomal protein L24